MLEVFTNGGGEYFVNTFNAVAAWTGGGGYRSMLQVVFVMGLAYSLFVVAFNLDWRAWMNWFLQATAIYMMLLVPTVTVKVTDRIDPGLAPAVVDNVPLGLGVMASFTSQFGDWMTETAETVFVMPAALKMTNNGMVYGARLMEKAQTFQITDPIFRANLDEHFKQCVFYDVLLGFTDMEVLTNSTNLWNDIGPGSPARAQKWLQRSGGGTVDSSIIPCNVAYANMSAQWNAEIDADLPLFSKSAYPKLIDSVATARMKADLPAVAAAMHGNATDPYAYLQQVSTIGAFMAARESFSDEGWDAYAAQRADAQARNTYTSIAQQAMTWVPMLGIVLSVVFYAMFPVIFPLFLFPRTGIPTLKGYATGFFYLASWGPLYVILHMFVMNRAASSYSALAPFGPTLLLENGISAVNNDIATIAGFLMMSVPFLAAGMARGAMAVAGHATSMLAPAQSAAEASAVERTTGNYAYGNTSFQNLTSNMRQANKWDERPHLSGGYATSSFTEANGVVSTGFSNGETAYDARQAISNLPVSPTQTSSFDQRVNNTAAEGQSQVRRLSENASESWSAAATAGTELMRTAEQRAASGSESGSGLSNSISNMNSVSQNLSSKVSQRFGLSEADSRDLSVSSQTIGSADAGIGVLAEKWGVKGKADIGARIASIVAENTGRRMSADQAYDELRDFTNSEINSSEARSARDDYSRETSSITNSRGESLSQRLGSTITNAREASLQSSQAEEAYRSFSKQFQVSEGSGYSVSRNNSQEFAQFVENRVLSEPNGIYGQFGSIPQILNPTTADQAQVRDVLMGEFSEQKMQALNHARRDMGLADPAPLQPRMASPSITSAEGVRSWGEHISAAVAGQGPDVEVRSNAVDWALRGEVSDRLEAGQNRVAAGGEQLTRASDDAGIRAAAVSGSVAEHEEGGVLGNIPYVSPLVEGAWDGVKDGAGWVADQVGLGGGKASVAPLARGERPSFPVSGRISSEMGMRVHPVTGENRSHQGIDIAARAGTPIVSTASGEVIRSGHTGGRGNFLEVRHADGSETRYFHMQNRPGLVEGDPVRKGDQLGQVGSTGRVTGPHLHYEIWQNGRPLDPRRYSVKDRE